MNIIDYIDENLPRCICYSPENSGTLIGLLYPYIVPCASDGFREMYYWDTYFTHKGLLIRGDLQQIRNDIDNMRYLIREYGFMPNGNRTFYLYNSQPPFLSMMMRDYYEVEKNKEWLEGAYEDLKLEYKFWKNYRMSDIGLNRYDCMKIPEEMVPSAARSFQERTGLGEGEREEDLASFKAQRLNLTSKVQTFYTSIITHLCFIFDINFKESYNIISENNFIRDYKYYILLWSDFKIDEILIDCFDEAIEFVKGKAEE